MPAVPLDRSAGDSSAPVRLTARERQVLVLRAEGRSVAEAAAMLQLRPRTVKFHLENLYAKLGLRQRSQGARQAALAHLAARLGYPPDAAGGHAAAPAGRGAPRRGRSSALTGS